jgi:superfamily II DNA helicase RecQ
MSFRVFQYALPAPPELPDLNAFLSSRRIATVHHHVVSVAGDAMLVFVVHTVPGSAAKGPVEGPPRTDYREQLSEEDFAIFSRLRAERRRIAEADGIPVYTVLCNAQLAEIVKRRVQTKEDLAAIEGIGRARVEKYGDRMLAVLAAAGVTGPAEGEPS